MEKRVRATFNQFCFFFCWKTSALKILARLPVSGYCPGQTMNLKLDMINNSDKDILHLLVHFIKVTHTISPTAECLTIDYPDVGSNISIK